MRGGGAVPGQLARARRAPSRAASSAAGSSRSSPGCLGERGDVPGRDDAAGAERLHGLGEPADVVDDRRHAGAERAQQRARLVELGAVGEERHRRLAERAVELGVREVAEPPLGAIARGRAVAVDRLHRVADDEQARAVDPLRRLDRVPERPCTAGSRRVRAACARRRRAAGRSGRRGAATTRSRSSGTPSSASTLAAALAVDDDPPEAPEQVEPEVAVGCRSTREEVVGGEDGRSTQPQECPVEPRPGEPLQVDDVGAAPARAAPFRPGARAAFSGSRSTRAAEGTRAPGVEELAPHVPVRRGRLAEAEARGDELDVGARAGERRGELVVVLRGERRWVAKEDAHGPTVELQAC